MATEPQAPSTKPADAEFKYQCERCGHQYKSLRGLASSGRGTKCSECERGVIIAIRTGAMKRGFRTGL
jgi:DNA-directed RNA polymerase subunit RPC12/RpoP